MVKIMLDAGHDINTAGKRSLDGSLREFEFNKAVVLGIDYYLKNYVGVETFYSHNLDDKIDQSLEYRTDLANKKGVDAFISIHANAASSTTANGIETFTHPNASKESKEMAKDIHSVLIASTDMEDRGLKTANFHVLRKTNMKAVLIECGFMTNEADLKLLKSGVYRLKCAEAIAKGIALHFKLKEKPKPVKNTVTQKYTVRSGESLEKIAKREQTTVKKLMELNPQIKNKNLIFAGQQIKIPK